MFPGLASDTSGAWGRPTKWGVRVQRSLADCANLNGNGTENLCSLLAGPRAYLLCNAANWPEVPPKEASSQVNCGFCCVVSCATRQGIQAKSEGLEKRGANLPTLAQPPDQAGLTNPRRWMAYRPVDEGFCAQTQNQPM
jgi:hypothetical protein